MQLVQLSPRVYQFSDICNVYAVVSGDRALLVDSGSGDVLDALAAEGITRVDWVLHTHHHRDQCQGDRRLAETATRIAVPKSEKRFFAGASRFWQDVPVFDIYDTSSVYNTLATDISVDHAVEDYEVFEWLDVKLLALPTPGHTRGSLTYVADIDGVRYAFCGDLIHAPGKAHTLHDMEWKYGMSEGFKLAASSAESLRTQAPDYLAPSHGAGIKPPEPALALLRDNLIDYVRYSDIGYQTVLGSPPLKTDSHIEQLSEHLLAVTDTCANFYVLLADGGEALFFDYGFGTETHMAADYRFVEHTLAALKERFGVHHVEVVVPTHYHDDHVCGIPFLQREFSTEVWAFHKFAGLLTRPSAYRIPCLWSEPIAVTRTLGEDETFTWRSHELTIRHNPGHTWYAASIFGEIDGKRVAVVGDEIQLSPRGTLWGGAPVYRNRMTGNDFTSSIRTILDYEPELVLTGHKGPLNVTRKDLESFETWAEGIERCWRELAPDPDAVGLALDPDWINVYPYSTKLSPGQQQASIEVEVRNHDARPIAAVVALDLPPGWNAEPTTRSLSLEARSSGRVAFQVAPAADATLSVRHVVTVSASVNDRPLGQVAEALFLLH